MVVLLLNDTQYARSKYGGTQYTGRNRAARSAQEGVTLMEVDCGTCIIFFRFWIPDQIYCNKRQKTTTFCLKHSFCKTIPPSLFTQTWVCLAISFHVHASVYVKRG